MARTIGNKHTQTEFAWAHALEHGFAIAPIIKSFELLKEAVPHVTRDPARSSS
jgi:hypothetical protein